MNTIRPISALVALALLAGFPLAASAAVPRVTPPPVASAFVDVSGECYAVGQQIATREGGTLYNASPDTRGGNRVCVIVVVIPQPEGQRPRRAEFVVPQ